MRRPHRNATILIFTCLIRRLDGSCMNSLILAVGYLGFPIKQPCPATASTHQGAGLEEVDKYFLRLVLDRIHSLLVILISFC
jgi:hypothetical protein